MTLAITEPITIYTCVVVVGHSLGFFMVVRTFFAPHLGKCQNLVKLSKSPVILLEYGFLDSGGLVNRIVSFSAVFSMTSNFKENRESNWVENPSQMLELVVYVRMSCIVIELADVCWPDFRLCHMLKLMNEISERIECAENVTKWTKTVIIELNRVGEDRTVEGQGSDREFNT